MSLHDKAKTITELYQDSECPDCEFAVRLEDAEQAVKDALEGFTSDLFFDINEYALEDDSKLTKGAQNLKQELLKKLPKLKELEAKLNRIQELINAYSPIYDFLEELDEELGKETEQP